MNFYYCRYVVDEVKEWLTDNEMAGNGKCVAEEWLKGDGLVEEVL